MTTQSALDVSNFNHSALCYRLTSMAKLESQACLWSVRGCIQKHSEETHAGMQAKGQHTNSTLNRYM